MKAIEQVSNFIKLHLVPSLFFFFFKINNTDFIISGASLTRKDENLEEIVCTVQSQMGLTFLTTKK